MVMKIKKDYYANKHGFQLRDYMKECAKIAPNWGNEIYSMEEGFFFLNAIKYKVRAGLKEENSFGSDLEKYSDYVDDLLELGVSLEIIEEAVKDYTERFYAWEGQTDEEFEEFTESFVLEV